MWKQLLLKTIRAFTLFEVIIAMILSSFVAIISFQAFQIINKQFHLLKKIDSYSNEILMLNYALHSDISNSDIILAYPKEIQLRNNIKPTIKYIFDTKSIIRETNQLADTFNIDYSSYKYFNNNVPVYSGEINQLDIDVEIKDRSIPLRFVKDYGSSWEVNKVLK